MSDQFYQGAVALVPLLLLVLATEQRLNPASRCEVGEVELKWDMDDALRAAGFRSDGWGDDYGGCRPT